MRRAKYPNRLRKRDYTGIENSFIITVRPRFSHESHSNPLSRQPNSKYFYTWRILPSAQASLEDPGDENNFKLLSSFSWPKQHLLLLEYPYEEKI